MSNEYKEVKRIISDAMLKLPEDDYQIIYELFFKHTSIHQLSKKLGISRSGIRYRKNKALKQLKSIISRQADVENSNF